MEKIKLDRINELAHKSKSVGLTVEEKAEQAVLRQEFLAEIRESGKTKHVISQDDIKRVVTEAHLMMDR